MVHELTHTIQQGIDERGSKDRLELMSSDQSLEHEAEAASRLVTQGRSFATTARGAKQIARQAAVAAQPQVKLTIVRQGGVANTFLSTDQIDFTVQATGAPNASALVGQTAWTVQGVSANSGNGNPNRAVNQANFSFTPNPTNRPNTGARVPNDPIEYRVEAKVGGATAIFDLSQDETDIIRQEYVDLGPVVPPQRPNIVIPTIPAFNTGNYNLIVDMGMNNTLNATQTQFQTLTQQAAMPAPGVAPPAGGAAAPALGVAPPGAGVAAPAPPIPVIGVTSGYRNPRRNVAAGSQFPVGSRHVWGSALDLIVAGANATLWDRLRQAGNNAGNTSICEVGPTQVNCADPRVNHVHIQW